MPKKTKKTGSPLDLASAETFPIRERTHRCTVASFGGLADPDGSARDLLKSLPDFLGARALHELAREIARAHREGRHVVFAMGAHTVKTGVAPVLIDLLERGIVTALAVNGAFVIHDYEIALIGETSEDVGATIRSGRFGWAKETLDAYAEACRLGAEEMIGLGRAMALATKELPHARHSVLAACWRLGVPITVHVAVGTDTVHMAPQLDGAHLGAATLLDFRIACRTVSELEGGVWVNVGSAVVMPEVFLKLVSVARNLGHPLEDVVAANLDMQRHYRTDANVIGRPVRRGIALLGHHEINLPLLRIAILCALGDAAPGTPPPESETPAPAVPPPSPEAGL